MIVNIAEIEAIALVDTGATCSILSFAFSQKIKNKYPSGKLEVCGIEYAKIKTVDGTEVKLVKGKLDLTVQVRKNIFRMIL